MRIRTLSLTAGVAFCLCAALGAQSPPTKIGVISMQEAIGKTKDGQKAAQQLDAKFQPKQKEFDRRQNELAQLQDQFNKGGSVLSEEKRTGLWRDIDQKRKRWSAIYRMRRMSLPRPNKTFSRAWDHE